MRTTAAPAILMFGLALACDGAVQADEIVTDANIVTGLDISDSITLDDLHLEIMGMAEAIRSPQILEAIRSGPHGRIGFAVFAWHYNQFPVAVSWTLIASADDADAVSRAIEARLKIDVEAEARKAEEFRVGRLSTYIGRLTDLSQAIDHAGAMLAAAPYATDRAVINIVGDGEDNVGEDAELARDRVVKTGAIVNGVVIGNDLGMVDYYRNHAIGGRGAFVMSVNRSQSMIEAMQRKFMYDIAMGGLPCASSDEKCVLP